LGWEILGLANNNNNNNNNNTIRIRIIRYIIII